MKKIIAITVLFLMTTSCGSSKSFQSFFNDHKNDLGVTAFQVPNFMRSLLSSISPEINNLFGNVRDFKFITFQNITIDKQRNLIKELDLVTSDEYTDILRTNSIEKTKIVSVKEDGNIVTKAIILNSTLSKTSVFYLKGRFNPESLKSLSETNQFDQLSTKLLQNAQPSITTPGFGNY